MRLSNGERLFHWPLALHVITAGWTYSNGDGHYADDFRTNQGGSIVKEVYAAEDAAVDQVQSWDGHSTKGMQSYGNMVRLRHEDYNGKTLQTRYAHLSSIVVKQGQQVKEGQLIGYTGQTGNVRGAHLHFEVILAGTRVNPLNWLDDDFTCASDSVRAHLGTYKSVQRPAASAPDKQSAPSLQMMCIVDADTDVLSRAKEAGLPIEQRTGYLIGPASSGDAMAIWQLSKDEGCRYFASSRDGGLQQLCVVGSTNAVISRAREAGLPVKLCNCAVIGPASMGDAMAVWGKAQAAQNLYFASFTES